MHILECLYIFTALFIQIKSECIFIDMGNLSESAWHNDSSSIYSPHFQS